MRQAFLLILAVGLTFSLQGCRVEDVQELVAFFQGESPADYTQEKAVTRAHAALVEYTRQEHLDITTFKGPYLEEKDVDGKEPSFLVYNVHYISPTHYFVYLDYTSFGYGGLRSEKEPNSPFSKWLDSMDPYSHDWSTLKTP